MIISPNTAISEGWITWNDSIGNIEKYIQPNAIDFDVSRIFELDDSSIAYLSEESKIIRSSKEISPIEKPHYNEKVWHLYHNKCYDFTSNFHVKLPAGVAAILIVRSTLNRSGIFLTSGLYDSGYNGSVAGMLRIHGGDLFLAPNTRIGQIKFIRSEDSGIMYTGGYNHSANSHWTESK